MIKLAIRVLIKKVVRCIVGYEKGSELWGWVGSAKLGDFDIFVSKNGVLSMKVLAIF